MKNRLKKDGLLGRLYQRSFIHNGMKAWAKENGAYFSTFNSQQEKAKV